MEQATVPTLATDEEVGLLIERAAAAGRFGIDTEFMSEGRYRALLCLAQIVVDDRPGGLARSLASLRRLQTLGPCTIYPGHGPIV